MYVLELSYANAKCNGTGLVSFRAGTDAVRRWTVLHDGAGSVELARLLALACLGRPFVSCASPFTHALHGPGTDGLSVGALLVLHAPRDYIVGHGGSVASGFRLLPDGAVTRHPALVWPGVPARPGGAAEGIRRRLALAYGPAWTAPGPGEDRFDFADMHGQRARRVLSVLDPSAPLSDAPAFLQRLHARMCKGRLPACLVMERLVGLLDAHLGVHARPWLERGADLAALWQQLPPVHMRILLPLVDAVRHVVDATPHDLDPLARPCIVVLVHPDRACSARLLPGWLTVLDRLLPAAQIVAVLPERALGQMPAGWRRQRLPLGLPRPQAAPRGPTAKTTAVRPDTTLLVDVDSRIPNLALMKLSAWHHCRGRTVVLTRKDGFRRISGEPDRVLASSVFNFPSSQRRLAELQERYGDRLAAGGSGVDLALRLPPEVEAAAPDLGLYPELGDRAIGFLTRGCSRRCRFCVVPRKEGPPRQVSDLDEVLQGRRKLVLLDDNLLAHPRADQILAELAARDVEINFNQTLDITLVDADRAALLRRIRCANYRFTRRCYHFSLNDTRRLEAVRRAYDHFRFRPRENVEFVCMYGLCTTLAEDVERFRFLRSLPGAYVFVQEYVRPLGGPAPRLEAFFGDRPDLLIDELVRIVFVQNMKSMEKYYRWLSRRYVEAFGVLHPALVDTIFRYNKRDQKGRYIARMLTGESDMT